MSNGYDMNNDGIIDDEELKKAAELVELENKDKKEDQLRRMAWISLVSILIVVILLFLPFVPDARIAALDNLITMFFISQAGIVAAFFGSSAYMSVNKS